MPAMLYKFNCYGHWVELVFVCGAELTVKSQRRWMMVHTCWKNWVFRRCLKVLSDSSGTHSEGGRLFQVAGPNTAKLRWPVEVRTLEVRSLSLECYYYDVASSVNAHLLLLLPFVPWCIYIMYVGFALYWFISWLLLLQSVSDHCLCIPCRLSGGSIQYSVCAGARQEAHCSLPELCAESQSNARQVCRLKPVQAWRTDGSLWQLSARQHREFRFFCLFFILYILTEFYHLLTSWLRGGLFCKMLFWDILV